MAITLNPRSGFRTHEETVAAGGTSAAVKLPHGMIATAAIIPGGGGTGSIEYTLSPYAAIDNATARWIPWDEGSVSAALGRSFDGAVTGLRAKAVTQAATFQVSL